MQISLELNFNSKLWSKENIIEKQKILSEIILKTLEIIKATNLCNILSFDITFVSDAMMKKYNLKSRNKPQATNVLSFPTEKLSKSDLKKFKMEYLYLGEIILSFETIKKESIQQNKSFNDHLLHLFTHAFLHLLGYTHDNDKERKQMEKLEISVLQNFDIKNPYKEIL